MELLADLVRDKDLQRNTVVIGLDFTYPSHSERRNTGSQWRSAQRHVQENQIVSPAVGPFRLSAPCAPGDRSHRIPSWTRASESLESTRKRKTNKPETWIQESKLNVALFPPAINMWFWRFDHGQLQVRQFTLGIKMWLHTPQNQISMCDGCVHTCTWRSLLVIGSPKPHVNGGNRPHYKKVSSQRGSPCGFLHRLHLGQPH